MPTKHVVKKFSAPAYYHVYNRASGERPLFRDDEDRQLFLDLLQKHLAELAQEDERTKTYEIQVVAYCLMGSHFHLLLFQPDEETAISGYMRSLSTAYAMYYNSKYKSKGHVFQSSYRASFVDNEAYLAHITRYIHLNPRVYETWKWSSYAEYIGARHDTWVHPESVLDKEQLGDWYQRFVAERADVDRRRQSSELTTQIAF